MKHRLTPILLVSTFLLVGGIFVKTSLVKTFERTVVVVPDRTPTTAPNLRVAPPDLHIQVPQDSPRRDSNHSPQTHSPR